MKDSASTPKQESADRNETRAGRKILVVGKGSVFTTQMMEYAIQLAERLGCGIMALNVNPDDSIRKKDLFEKQANSKASVFKAQAADRGVHCEHIVYRGETEKAISEITRTVKRIEFALIETDLDSKNAEPGLAIPVYRLNQQQKGETNMSGNQSNKGKPIMGTIVYGMISAAVYAAIFMNADTVMRFFTKGGWYAALPIASVFVVSFVHGNFAGNLWSLLGIEAAKTGEQRVIKRKSEHETTRIQQRPRVYKYINPFHRL
jgi:K+-sensing histidine kinase KdpD